MAQKFPHERAAVILAEAVIHGDAATAKKWGCTTRTIANYRDRLDQDSLFAELFIRKREALEQDWISEAPATLRSAISFLKRAAEQGDPTNPDQVKAVSSALATIAEVVTTKEVIDARIAQMGQTF